MWPRRWQSRLCTGDCTRLRSMSSVHCHFRQQRHSRPRCHHCQDVRYTAHRPLISRQTSAGACRVFKSFIVIDTHPFNGPLSGTTRVSRYQKGKTNLDFTETRDSEWQWHQPGHMQACTSLQTDNQASTSPLSFLQARCPSCRPTNSVKALWASY